MPSLDAIFVATYARDLVPLRFCLESIREHYPSLPLYVLKDESKTAFDIPFASEFGVQILEGERYGHAAFNKLIPAFNPMFGHEYALVLDSDTLLLKPISDDLLGGDITIWPEHVGEDVVDRVYYDRERLRRLDPDFVHPGYNFNTGQFIVRCGFAQGSKYASLINWGSSGEYVDGNTFKLWEQGVFNYIVQRMEADECIEVLKRDFALFSRNLDDGAPPSEKSVLHYCTYPRTEDALLGKGPLADAFRRAPLPFKVRATSFMIRRQLRQRAYKAKKRLLG